MFGLTSFKSALGRLRDDRGNVAIVVALSMIPLCVVTLGAVDLARAVAAKVHLQNSLDAAALGAARLVGSDEADLQAAGHRLLLQGLEAGNEVELDSSSFTFGEDGKILASATAHIDPYVRGLLGIDDLNVSTSTEVVRAGYQLEIALVLDNTLSMAQNSKLDHLKTAATHFVDFMETAAEQNIEPDAIKISLVPFSHTVRLDSTAYRYSSWIDQNGAAPINNEIFTTANGTQFANRFTLLSSLGTTWRGCVESRQSPYDVQDTAPTTGTPATLFTPYFWPDDWDDRPNSEDRPNDYVDDGSTSTNWRVRQGSVTKYHHPNRTLGTNYGPNKACSMLPLRRLSTDFDGVRTAINGMVATGYTNIPMGLVWGWHTLAPHAPFSDGVPYLTEKHKKIVVLMTDGNNTIEEANNPTGSPYSGTAFLRQGRVIGSNGLPLTDPQSSPATRTAALDHRLSLLCQNMKAPAKDIEIYTIRVEVTTGSSTVLQTCATDADHYYDVSNAAQLDEVFRAIAGQIAALHLSK